MKNDVGIFGRLKKEHSEVSEMIDKLKQGDVEDRKELLPKLEAELVAHAKAEQETIYERLRGISEFLTCTVDDGFEEHDSIEEMLGELKAADPGSDEFVECLETLEECIDHHVDDEENEMFPAAKKSIDVTESVDIERAYVEAKSKHLRRLDGAGGADGEWDDLSKDELYKRAQALGIPGRSQMTKSQLIREIRNHY